MAHLRFELFKYAGYSKGINTVDMFLVKARLFPRGKQAFTVYEIAKGSGLSARHVQRCCERLFADGWIDFNTVTRKGKPAREWFVK